MYIDPMLVYSLDFFVLLDRLAPFRTFTAYHDAISCTLKSAISLTISHHSMPFRSSDDLQIGFPVKDQRRFCTDFSKLGDKLYQSYFRVQAFEV